jgi:hypothetical protein
VSRNALLSNIDELAQLPLLSTLFAHECRLQNVAALAKCPSLVAVYLSGNESLEKKFQIDSKIASDILELQAAIVAHYGESSEETASDTINGVYISSGMGLRAADLKRNKKKTRRGTICCSSAEWKEEAFF